MSSQRADVHTGHSNSEVEYGLPRQEAPPGCDDSRSLPHIEDTMHSVDSADHMMAIHAELLPSLSMPEIPSAAVWHGTPNTGYYVADSTYHVPMSPYRASYGANRSHNVGEPPVDLSNMGAYGPLPIPMHWNLPESLSSPHHSFHTANTRHPTLHQAYPHEAPSVNGYYQQPTPQPSSKDILIPSIIEGSESSNQSETASTGSHGMPSPPDMPHSRPGASVVASMGHLNNKHAHNIGAVAIPTMPHTPHAQSVEDESRDSAAMDDEVDHWMATSPSHYRYHQNIQEAIENHDPIEVHNSTHDHSNDGMHIAVDESSSHPHVYIQSLPATESHTMEVETPTMAPLPGNSDEEMAARLELRKARAVPPSRRSKPARTTSSVSQTRSKSVGSNIGTSKASNTSKSAASRNAPSTPRSSTNAGHAKTPVRYPTKGRNASLSAAEANLQSGARPSPPYSAPVSRASHSNVTTPASPMAPPQTPPLERAATAPILRSYSYLNNAPSDPIKLVPLKIGEIEYSVSHKQASRITKRLACPTRPSQAAPPGTPSRSSAAEKRTRSQGKFEKENKPGSPPKKPKK